MPKWDNKDSAERVDAEVLTGENVNVLANWADAVITHEIDPFSDDRYPALNVQCSAEVKRASMGDYVIRHEDGGFDVLSPLIFRNTYTQEYI